MFSCNGTFAAKWFSMYRRYDESDIFCSAGGHIFPLPFDLASRLFHRAFCTRRLFRLASFFLSLADLRRQGKVICCLSHEARRRRGSLRVVKRSGMNTMAVANINFYFLARKRISPAFKAIPILDDEKWRYFRCTGRPCPVIRISSEAILVKTWILRKIYGRLENGRANFPRTHKCIVFNFFSIYDTSRTWRTRIEDLSLLTNFA